jgi:hypothetical protein
VASHRFPPPWSVDELRVDASDDGTWSRLGVFDSNADLKAALREHGAATTT